MFKNYWALLVPLLVLLIALYFMLGRNKHNEADAVIGMVDVSSVDVAAELPGRMDSLFVREGDTVQKGKLLGVLQSTEINAIRQQALAAVDAAKGQLDLLQRGARPEIVASSNNLYKIAQDQYDLFNKTYTRMQRLYNDEVISGQEKDLVYFKMEASKKEMETAKLNLEMLQKGTSPEVIQSAKAILRQAEHGYELMNSLTGNTRIYAPATGVISSLVIHEGEIVSIGYPIITIQKSDAYFIRFNVRQDKIKAFKLNDKATVTVPGCTPEQFGVTISSVSPSLAFANWVPVKEKGAFELRTFTVECKPAENVTGLRAGMTASLQLP
ncbi:efflux RND transporter periplasmic adaptor subunit [Danxiaibacter flavus]|uniref:Efflux RND transporter periplasmic adaptor subunit n=1 Tax=Danxiaibacter flavus TaxID=3049108 RepID=A0ABV3Z7U7_9BACT|nr:efflux RND transporter periplasmic adaptor subunit [Chitinophagaceae bacterium DXS]